VPVSTATPDQATIDRLLDVIEESHRLIRAGRAGAGWMDLDLTLGQLRFLHGLNRAGSLSIGHVADQLGVTLTTASQFVNRLERRGYVERVHRADDRRVVECRLTTRGADVTAAMRGMQRDVMRALLVNLRPGELRVLERLYRLMLDRARAAATAATAAGASTAAAPQAADPSQPASAVEPSRSDPGLRLSHGF
jgi:DNA-binding MarR family transcriptional regulator